MEDGLGFARQRFAELDASAGLNHAGEDLAALLQPHVAQIVAVGMQQIESDEIEVVLAACDRLAKLAEVRQAGIVEHDDLAVDNSAFGAETLGLFHQVAIFCCPVVPVARVDPGAVFIDDELRMVAVELDLVTSTIALGRLLNKGRHQGRDELQTHARNSHRPRLN